MSGLRNASGAMMLAIVGMTAAALPAPAAFAQSKVAVLVNDQPITTYEIQARGKMLSAFSRGKQGAKDAQDQLVEERLMMQEAKLRGFVVSDAELDEEVARRAKGNKMSGPQFEAAMAQAGIDPKTFRAFLASNMSWARVVRARFQSQSKVSDQDVTAALAKKGAAPDAAPAAVSTISEYMLQPIIFIVPAGSDPGLATRRQGEAAAFRAGYRGCDGALTQIAGKPGVAIKPTVRRDENQLPKSLKDEIAALQIGGITAPQRVDDGVQLLGLCARQAVPGATTASEEVRSELNTERGELMARRYLRDLKADAVIEYR